MMAFQNATQRGREFEKQKLLEAQMLQAIPGAVLDGLLSRFAEQQRGSAKYVFALHTFQREGYWESDPDM
jgi:hypothetical protein